MKRQSMTFFTYICAILTFAFVLFFCPLKEVKASSDTENGTHIKIAYQNGDAVDSFTLEPGAQQDLRFLGAPADWKIRNPRWFSSNPDIVSVDHTGLVTAHKEGIAAVIFYLEPNMADVVWVHVENPPAEELPTEEYPAEELPTGELPTESAQSKEDELPEEQVKPASNQLILRNQEAILIPKHASFTNGIRLSNVRDIASWAFSYMLTDGTQVVPTYEGSKTGVAEIIDVAYRANSRAKSVIIKSVTFKVYFDTNNDGWVSAEEKSIDATGYYYIQVEVDKTVTVEDWSIVTK